jgi:hypothetical protein
MMQLVKFLILSLADALSEELARIFEYPTEKDITNNAILLYLKTLSKKSVSGMFLRFVFTVTFANNTDY